MKDINLSINKPTVVHIQHIPERDLWLVNETPSPEALDYPVRSAAFFFFYADAMMCAKAWIDEDGVASWT